MDVGLCRWAMVRMDEEGNEYWECMLQVVIENSESTDCALTSNVFDTCSFYEKFDRKSMEAA